MEIHELNTFSGTPGNNNYLAIDDGTDTGKISGTNLLAPVNTRIDNLVSAVTVDSEVIDGRVGADGVTYGSLGTAIRTQVSDLKDEINKLASAKSINLIDLKTLVDGVYISNSDGTEITYSTWSATDYIEIQPKTYYQFISTLHGNYAATDNVYFAFYDASKTYISGGRNNEINTTISPDNARYIRLSTITSVFTGYGAMYGKQTDFESIIGGSLSAFVPYWKMIDGIKTVYVSNTSAYKGDFSKVADAVKAANDGSKWNILIYPSTYNVLDELGGSSYMSTVPSLGGATGGLNLPNNVNLIGLGADRSEVVLRGNCNDYSSLSDSVRDQCVTKTSIINMNQSNKLKNLTVVGQNVRYAIHDESNNSYQNYERIIEDCEVVHNGNASSYSWTSVAALGCGSGSGAKYLYKNSRFKAKTPYSIHDNTGFTHGNSIRFENCEFVAESSDGVAVRFGTVSGEAEIITHDVVLNNCRFKGTIGQYEEGGKGRKWFIHGGGNSVVPYLYTSTSSSAINRPIAFNEETVEITNNTGSTISKGTPVMLASLSITPMVGDGCFRLYGIALEDIANGASGFIKTSGFLYNKDTPIGSWNNGTKIGIISGTVSTVSGDDYFAVGVAWDCAKFV